jgi:hypothetical protein
MSGNDEHITPGMQKYIDQNNKYLAERASYIDKTVKQWKFDTIAVHGLYSVTDALKDSQSSIIEPVFMSTSQAYNDSDGLQKLIKTPSFSMGNCTAIHSLVFST